ncbi:hypothetical protein GS501_00360 [Saccharibacter sp. 17.LH.SD]|uniref:ion channel n=1 Tax=Saccharibacter sp. 17.LH.SD TaxID=2689393 RepID=UPI001368671A|nr:ion channel [Saccharibacter sp. 17.LH.SD]MXV43532.1 hypothetical protein [Saccharibacter sp. 17.LH.SD]
MEKPPKNDIPDDHSNHTKSHNFLKKLYDKSSILKVRKKKIYLNHDDIVSINIKNNIKNDLYHYFIQISWWKFSFLSFLVYCVICLFFATLLYPEWAEISSIKNPSLLTLFFFSIETLSTVGFGFMAPTQAISHTIVSIELFTGILVNAVVTGLIFARFTRIPARVNISDDIVVYEEGGIKYLSVQIINERKNSVISLNSEMTLLRIVQCEDKSAKPIFEQITLKENFIPILQYYHELCHAINEESPFYQMSSDDFQKESFRIFLYINGIDDVTRQNIFARKTYKIKNIKESYRFENIMNIEDNGTIIFDAAKAGKIVPSSPQVDAPPHDPTPT